MTCPSCRSKGRSSRPVRPTVQVPLSWARTRSDPKWSRGCLLGEGPCNHAASCPSVHIHGLRLTAASTGYCVSYHARSQGASWRCKFDRTAVERAFPRPLAMFVRLRGCERIMRTVNAWAWIVQSTGVTVVGSGRMRLFGSGLSHLRNSPSFKLQIGEQRRSGFLQENNLISCSGLLQAFSGPE